MNKLHSSLLVATALILYTLLSPIFRTTESINEANQHLNLLYKQIAELKTNKGISDELKLIEGTKLQAQIENQKKAVEEAKAQANTKTTTEIIVMSCLGLMLIWIVFSNYPILYLSFTVVALAVSVYSYLLSAFNLNLLDYETMGRILIFCIGVVGTILFAGITLNYYFNKVSSIGVRDAELAVNPIAISAHAKALELQVVATAQQLAFNKIGQIKENDFVTFDKMEKRNIHNNNWTYDNSKGWTEEKIITPDFRTANNHATGQTYTGKGA